MRKPGFLPPLSIFLLPLFFVLHGFTEYYDLVPLLPAVRLLVLYCLASLVIFAVSFFLLKDKTRAGILTIVLMSYQFFFGSVQDAVRQLVPGSFLNRYSFILPFSLLMLAGIYLLLKRYPKDLKKLSLYVHVLLLVLLLVDAVSLLSKIRRHSIARVIPPAALTRCDSCSKPDIYLIIADGYPGRRQFNDILQHDNSAFYSALTQRGFQVTDSSISNYNFTFFSMASLLNMHYLQQVSGSIRDLRNIPAGRKAFRNSQVPAYLQSLGYTFINHSIFDFPGNPAPTTPTFWINDTRPISNQTFLSRLNRDLGYHLMTTLRLRPVQPFPRDLDLKNNELLFRNTLQAARYTGQEPRFIYTHLMMPHHPYYFDSSGRRIPDDSLTQELAFQKKAAVQYITYSNRRLLSLLDSIQRNARTAPVIILLSDHGFREIREEKDKPSMFLNLQAIYMPDGHYPDFYTGMSNVNFFRLFLNRQFRQNLPLLKDSTIFLSD